MTKFCGFPEAGAQELNVRGHSDWINVFTMDEWIAYGYISSLGYYWCHGLVIYASGTMGYGHRAVSNNSLHTARETRRALPLVGSGPMQL